MEKNSHDRIAYFTMEVGISHTMPTYAGGLGILAGDVLKSFADLKLPVVGVTLLNQKGFFNQIIDENGNQVEEPVDWNPSEHMVLMPNIINVTIEGRVVSVRVWRHIINGVTGHHVSVYFLDTNLEGNSDYDRSLTSYLYGMDKKYRLAQEIILGVGGVRMLDSLGYNIKKYHMNEGHSALLTIELLRRHLKPDGTYDWDEVRNKCIFTTHTPVAAGHDKFDIGLFRSMFGNIDDHVLEKAIHDDYVNMSFLALNMSEFVNGVAKRHGEISREMFPHYQIDSITNGVHSQTWVSPPFKELFNKYIPEWATDQFSLRYALSIPKKEILDAHSQAKQLLIDEINSRTDSGFHPARFTIGYARRFTEYKRPKTVLQDLDRLKKMAENVGDIQIVFAGKAHPNDTRGKELIREVIGLSRRINAENSRVKIVFLDKYDMRLAKLMVAGCDVWLNTPQRPLEASGTSGMKAALNGVPHVSTLDGWWLEGHIEGITGWSIGPHPSDPGFNNDPDAVDEANDLYNKLEKVIIPAYYSDPLKWADICLHCIAINGSFFNTYRMAQQYVATAYNVD